MAETVHLALKPTEHTAVLVKVMPKATCTFETGAPARKIFADDVGVLHFTIRPTHEGAGATSLQCRDEDGTERSYPLVLEGTSDAAALAETKARMQALSGSAPGTVRPPLAGDPMSYSQNDLVAAGYGLRPDPVAQPGRYAHWLRAASQPSTIVSGRTAVGDLTYGPNDTPSFSTNWSGGMAGNPGGPWPGIDPSGAYFWYASGEWNVPKVFAESSIANASQAATWVGLGGDNNSLLWQAGTGEITQSILWFEAAWYEAVWDFPQLTSGPQVVSNFSVNDGDDIFTETYQCNPAQNNQENPLLHFENGLCAHIHNYTQNEDYFTMQFIGWVLLAQTAEAIQERPGSPGAQDDYAQFNAFNFKSTDVCASAGGNVVGGCNEIGANRSMSITGGSSPFTTTMSQIGDADHPIGESCMADSSGNCRDDGDFVHVQWDAHN